MNRQLKITFHPFFYTDLCVDSGGELPRDMRAHACWYFYTIAQKVKEAVGGGSIDEQFGLLDGELWMDKRYEQQARAVAAAYGLESPDEFAKFWEFVWRQALDLNLPKPAPEYMRPLRRLIIN